MKKTNNVLAVTGVAILFLGGFALSASAQDANELQQKANEQVRETQQKTDELLREAQKKTVENVREAEKKAVEGLRETQKKANKEVREADKKAMELLRETQKKGAESAREAQKDANEQAREAEKNKRELEKEMRNASSSDQEGDDAGGHRSAVAKFVERLHQIASSTPGGIGDQVREVARVQGELKEKTADALQTVESRGAFMKFLIGVNKKNVDELKNSAATLQNHIERLNQIKSQLGTQASSTVGTVLDEEIGVLAKEQQRVLSVVKENQNRSGVFGWLTRFFQ